jgi:hypothetical protein
MDVERNITLWHYGNLAGEWRDNEERKPEKSK